MGIVEQARLGALGFAAENVMPEVRNLWFNGQTVALDGYRFIGCRFDRCTLTVAGPHFSLIHCLIDDSTNLQYSPNVVKVIQLFNIRPAGLLGPSMPFLPVRNADGTISIGV
jgi:hypothetical protein